MILRKQTYKEQLDQSRVPSQGSCYFRRETSWLVTLGLAIVVPISRVTCTQAGIGLYAIECSRMDHEIPPPLRRKPEDCDPVQQLSHNHQRSVYPRSEGRSRATPVSIMLLQPGFKSAWSAYVSESKPQSMLASGYIGRTERTGNA